MAALPAPGASVRVGPPLAARGPRRGSPSRRGPAQLGSPGSATFLSAPGATLWQAGAGSARIEPAALPPARPFAPSAKVAGPRRLPENVEILGPGGEDGRVGEHRAAGAAPGGHGGVGAREPAGPGAVGRERAVGDRDRAECGVDRPAGAAVAPRPQRHWPRAAVAAVAGEVAREGGPRDRHGPADRLDGAAAPAVPAVAGARPAELAAVAREVVDEARVDDREARRRAALLAARDRAPGAAPADGAAAHHPRRAVTGGVPDEGHPERGHRPAAANRAALLARVALRGPSVADRQVLEREARALEEVERPVEAARVDRRNRRSLARDPQRLGAQVEVSGHARPLAGPGQREDVHLGVEPDRVGPRAGGAALERRVVAGRDHRLAQRAGPVGGDPVGRRGDRDLGAERGRRGRQRRDQDAQREEGSARNPPTVPRSPHRPSTAPSGGPAVSGRCGRPSWPARRGRWPAAAGGPPGCSGPGPACAPAGAR